MAWEPNDLDLRANYDLGVEAGKALREQEIIKLLEAETGIGQNDDDLLYRDGLINFLIALIKVEK